MSNTLQKESIENTECFPQELVYQSVIDGSDEAELFAQTRIHEMAQTRIQEMAQTRIQEMTQTHIQEMEDQYTSSVGGYNLFSRGYK